jgi:hypothetical protein
LIPLAWIRSASIIPGRTSPCGVFQHGEGVEFIGLSHSFESGLGTEIFVQVVFYENGEG